MPLLPATGGVPEGWAVSWGCCSYTGPSAPPRRSGMGRSFATCLHAVADEASEAGGCGRGRCRRTVGETCRGWSCHVGGLLLP